MPTSLRDEKHTDQNRAELRTIWVFVLTTVFILAIAAFVGTVF
jgi:hypothetical protein